MNLRSLLKENLSMANMRSKGSSESLILVALLAKADCSKSQNSTQRIYLADPDNASTPSWVLVPATRPVMKDACGIDHLTYRQTTDDETNMAAMSLTPKHFLTSWTIILTLPPSPVSPDSGTEIGGSSSVGVLTPSSGVSLLPMIEYNTRADRGNQEVVELSKMERIKGGAMLAMQS
jgi:hypothetical protein